MTVKEIRRSKGGEGKVTKSGWWQVKFELTLDGQRVRFQDLSEESQKHITDLILEGYLQGEIIEENEELEESE